MNFTTILKDIEAIPTDLKDFFTKHGSNIQADITETQTAIADASAVLAIAAPTNTGVQHALGKVSGALSILSSGVSAETSATTITQQAAALTGIAAGLQSTGIVGSNEQAAINKVTAKVSGITAVLQNAVAAAPAS
jgi:hypothetical protein